MAQTFTLSVSFIMPIIRYLEGLGMDRESLLRDVGIDPVASLLPDTRCAMEQLCEVLDQAMKLTGDENLGIHVGELWPPEKGDIVGYIALNCKTVGEAFQKNKAYQKILSESHRVDIQITDNDVIVRNSVVPGMSPFHQRQHVLCTLSSTLTYVRHMTGHQIELKEARFEFQAPDDLSEYDRFFQAPVHFNQAMNALVFDKKYHDLPIAQPDEYLLFILEQHAKKILGRIQETNIYSRKVSNLIIKEFQGDTPSIKRIAGRLAMTVRNLQYKLEGEKTTFRNVVETVRKEMAISHLRQNELTITEIAYLMGFSESSTFSRIFKRWTGITPSEFRKNVYHGL
jgi:AraC-like DNA-binding protein